MADDLNRSHLFLWPGELATPLPYTDAIDDSFPGLFNVPVVHSCCISLSHVCSFHRGFYVCIFYTHAYLYSSGRLICCIQHPNLVFFFWFFFPLCRVAMLGHLESKSYLIGNFRRFFRSWKRGVAPSCRLIPFQNRLESQSALTWRTDRWGW